MSFTLFKIRFSVSVPFAVMLAFLLLMDTTGLMSASLMAVAVHELGHLFAMKKQGCSPHEIRMGLGGILMVGKRFSDFIEGLIVSLSGPVANLLAFCVLWGFGRLCDSATLTVFAAVQFLVGAVNLSPVKGLDGGAILSACLVKFGCKNPKFVCTAVSLLFACALTVAGLAVCVKNVSNPSLLLLGIYLIMINIYRCNS